MTEINEVVESILSNISLVNVISRYVKVKKSGKNYMGLCPFHPDSKSPSLSISEDKGLYHCFGCGASGNVITFISKIEGIPHIEAIKRLAYEIGIDITLGGKGEKEKYIHTNQLAANHFHNYLLQNLNKNGVLTEFIKNRQIDDSLIKKFNLGFAPFDAYKFIDELKLYDLNKNVAEKLNIIGYTKVANKSYFKLQKRFIFPIMDINGYTIGFGGRILGQNPDSPKYINSSNSPVYNKSKTLYGLNFAKEEIKNKDLVILVEGYFDMMSLYKFGIKNVVASSGTALTQYQVNLIKRFTEKVAVFYDSDDAGQKAAFRSIELFIKSGVTGKIYTLPVKDPDEYIYKYGKENFYGLLKNKGICFVNFYLSALKKLYNFSVKKEKKDAYAQALELSHIIDDNDEKEIFLTKISECFNYKAIFVEEDYKKHHITPSQFHGKNEEKKLSENRVKDNYSTSFEKFLSFIFQYYSKIEKDLDTVDYKYLPANKYKTILRALLDFIEINNEFDAGKFIEFLTRDGKDELVSLVVELLFSDKLKKDNVEIANTFKKLRLQTELFGTAILIDELSKKICASGQNSGFLYTDLADLNLHISELKKKLGGLLYGSSKTIGKGN
jgi:DNA primase